MSHWIVVFTDTSDMTAHRAEKFAEHLAYLHDHDGMFIDGAPLSDDVNLAPTGGIWIVKAETKEEVLELVNNDPMFDPSLRSYRVFCAGKALDTSRVEKRP